MSITANADGLVTFEAGDTYTLPTGTYGHTYRVKNISTVGLATVNTTNGQTIDGDPEVSVAPATTLTVTWHGSFWAVISIPTEKLAITKEGGIAVKRINKTGATSFKGALLKSSATENAVELSVVDDPNPAGIMYDDGIPDGSECLVVLGGLVEIYFVDSTTAGYIARGFFSTDAGYVPGQCLCEAAPTPPFEVEKRAYTVAQVQQSRTGPGLALCMIPVR